jgi:outer membrane protein assembly factor BamB
VVRGAGDDGRTTVVMLTPSSNRGGVLLAIGRDGTVARQLEVDVPVGRPALVANLAFIPWQNQYVTVYDLASGDEVARVTLRHQTSHAFVTDGALYFGEVGLTRFDDKIGAGSRGKASHVDLPARELPGAPRWMRQGGVVPKRLADASDRIAIFARPASGGEKLGVDNDRFYATYFHAVLGLKASSGELAWVRSSTHDVIAGAAYAGGVVVCDDKGGVAMFDAAAGSEAGKLSFGQPLQSCVVQADTLERRASKAGAEPLVHQISQAIDTKETEMVMMQRFLLRELVAQSSELATKRLVELASDPRTSPVLLKDARDGLSARRNGTSYMMQALARRYDFLADVLVAPPVAPIADALAAMDEKSAADSLLEHLLDPSTPEDDVKHAAMALQKLAAPRHLEGLQTFLQLNRCTADDEAMVEAVVTVARTLLRVGGVEAAKLVAAAAERATTTAPLKPLLAELVRTASPERPRPR